METRNPEKILKQLQAVESGTEKGKLKIFFGYAAGVGKTYAMLEAAHDAISKGIDVVAGYIEPHTRPATMERLKGIPQLPVKKVPHGEVCLGEFDLDMALRRKPQLLLVDELAHTNAPGCRHEKRYQDVLELLRSGIDVYTTVNVQHIESLNDDVASITGIAVRERIPDSVFDRADQVEIVDIEPQELVDRLKEGKVYGKPQAQRAMANFFTIPNLTALREIALRRCADRVNTIGESTGIRREDCRTEENILVCLSPSPSNAKIIRTAARMAQVFKGSFTGLFVETPDFPSISQKDLDRLRTNMHLAEELGARIETVYGSDVPFQIAEFARLSGVTKIVIGRSAAVPHRFWGSQSLTDKLIANAPQLDIHIIPDSASAPHKTRKKRAGRLSLLDFLKTTGILVLCTLACGIFDGMHFGEANIITIYVFGVLIISVITKSKLWSMLGSMFSVLVFNFFFTDPRLSLQAYDPGYPITFLIMFLSATLTGSLAVKLKNHAKSSALAAYRNKVLFDVNQALQQADKETEILSITATQLLRLLGRDVVLYPLCKDSLGQPEVFLSDSTQAKEADYLNENERTVALWVLKNNKHAGATTQTLSRAKCLYLAIRIQDRVYGVAGIQASENPLDSSEKSMLLSVLGECALAMENDRNAREKEAAAILAQKEQLRANLLRAISHDLRTPLTSISGNASNFLSNGDTMDQETKRQLFTDIYDDSMWLINLVENILSVTRLEENRLNLRLSSELVSDVIEESLRHVGRKAADHPITVTSDDDYMMAQMDPKLIVQVIVNIVDNAIKYTPPGSPIGIHSERRNNQICIEIWDSGSGIPDEVKPKVFDMFYCGANKVADSRRSLGLGLSLCKTIITAHGGEISVRDHTPQGTVFSFTLPEVTIHE